MYYCRTINYNMSDLIAADRYLLQFVKPLTDYAVSKIWIEEFCNFLIERQKEFLQKNKRAKEVVISWIFSPNYPSTSMDRACIRVGSINIHFNLVKGDLCSFDLREKNSFYDTINQITTK